MNSQHADITTIAQASKDEHMEVAYAHDQNRVLAVVTRDQYLRSKFGFEASGGKDVNGRLSLVTPEGRKDITRSRCWYDIREDGVHKYHIGNLSIGAISNFVYATHDLKNLNYPNFVAWENGRTIDN